jgi:hypothetical protein
LADKDLLAFKVSTSYP